MAQRIGGAGLKKGGARYEGVDPSARTSETVECSENFRLKKEIIE